MTRQGSLGVRLITLLLVSALALTCVTPEAYAATAKLVPGAVASPLGGPLAPAQRSAEPLIDAIPALSAIPLGLAGPDQGAALASQAAAASAAQTATAGAASAPGAGSASASGSGAASAAGGDGSSGVPPAPPGGGDGSGGRPDQSSAAEPDHHLAAFEAAGHIGNAHLIRRRLLALKDFFRTGVPNEELLGPALAPSESAARTFAGPLHGREPSAEKRPEPPAPERKAPEKGSRASSALGRVASFLILAAVVAQIGYESLGSAMPALLQKTFGDFSVVADIAILSSLSSILGRLLAPALISRLGLKKTFLGALGIRLTSISILAGLLATGHMTLPVLSVLYAFNGLLMGLSITAENTVPTAILGQDPAKLERFGAWKQALLETIGSLGPIATGAIVAKLGFLPALIAFPVSVGLSIVIMALTLKIPQKLRALASRPAAAEAPARKPGSVFKDFARKIAHGAKVVWGNPLLKTTFLAFTVFMMLNPFLYTVVAPAYGMHMAHGQAEQSAGIYGMMTGLYSLGGLLGGLLMILEQRRLKKLRETAPGGGRPAASDAQIQERLRKSMLRWMLWGTVSLAAIATMALPLPMLGAVVSLPGWLSWAGGLTVPALALIPFGIAEVVSTIKLQSFFQSRTPEGDVTDATGFLGAASLGISTVGLVALKFLFTGKLPFGFKPLAFSGLHGLAPFVVIALAMVPLAAYYLYVTRRLSKISAPPPPR